jgi:hypothetical protein
LAIDRIAWAIPPGGKRETRPAKLVSHLIDLGEISADASYFFHGRAESSGRASNAGLIRPKLEPDNSALAVFSPVFTPSATGIRRWTDFYDDWSIAPDINLPHRLLSTKTYREFRLNHSDLGLVTCNSEYLRAKLRLENDFLVPNGVDESLGAVEGAGDSKRRLIVLGHFFKGRTDFDLLVSICIQGRFDEIVIGSPGSTPQMSDAIAAIRAGTSTVLVLRDWLNLAEEPALLGDRTVALIPHLVNDYTLSQDLMKAYQFLALGIRVICPRLLWPSHLDIEHALLVGIGVAPEMVSEWVDASPPTPSWRLHFAQDNSWLQRAQHIARLLRRQTVGV